MDVRGQAYSVFKLLIAAIVAVSILMILMAILNALNIFVVNDPLDTATKNITGLTSMMGAPRQIDLVTFTPNYLFPAKTIAESTDQLGQDQVCVVIGNSLENDDRFRYSGSTDGRVINYKGNTDQAASLWLMCSRANEIEDDLSDTGLDEELDIDACEGDFADYIGESATRLCIVGVSRESG